MKIAPAILIGFISLLLGLSLRRATSSPSTTAQNQAQAPIQSSSRTTSTSPYRKSLKRTLQIPQSTQRWLQTIALLEKAELNDMQGIAQSIGFADDRITQLVAQRWFELDPQHFFDSSLAEVKKTPSEKSASFACFRYLRFLARQWPLQDFEAALDAFSQPDPKGFLEGIKGDFVNHLCSVDINKALEVAAIMEVGIYPSGKNHIREAARKAPRNVAQILFHHFDSNKGPSRGEWVPGENLLKPLSEIWSKNDPLDALAFADSHQNDQGQYLRRKIIEGWLAHDRVAAGKWLEDQTVEVQERHRPDLLKSWATEDPQSAFAWFQDNLQGTDNELNNLRWLLNGAIEKDVAEAAALIPQIEALDLSWTGVTEVTQQWFRPDENRELSTKAIDWLRSLGETHTGEVAIKSAMETWSQSDPDGMKRYLEEERNFDYPPQIYETLVKALTNRDPVSALEWSANLGEKSENLLRIASKIWITKRPEAAVNWLRNSPINPQAEAALLEQLSLAMPNPSETELILPQLGPANREWVQARFKEN